jgi:N-ethylmaleimide reductase
VGIRFSPYSTLGDLPAYADEEVYLTYQYLARELDTLGIAYIHIAVNVPIPQRTLDMIRASFTGAIILCNGLTPETAEAALHDGFADLVAFGRPFLANPDLAERIARHAELNQPDYTTFYTPGAQGYTDYPALTESTMNQTNMNAILLTNYGPAENLRFQEITTPVPAATDVLIHVKASAVNKLDILKASGVMQAVFPLPLPWVPGIDFAGVIKAVGSQVQGFRVGDEVYGASLFGGANAEYITIKPQFIALKPHSLTFIKAASVPVAAQTAWQVIFQDAQVKSGQTILIHGGAGAVGSYAIQFAHQAGAKVIVTAAADSEEYVKTLGADVFIDYKKDPFESVVGPVDAVIDLVGGEVQQRSYALIKAGGHLVSTTQPVSADLAAERNIQATFTQLQPSHEGLAQIANQIDAGQLKINLGDVFPLAKTAEAWNALFGNPAGSLQKKNGRIVLDHA